MVFVCHVGIANLASPYPVLAHLASFSVGLALRCLALILGSALCVVKDAFFLDLGMLFLSFLGISLLSSSELVAVGFLQLPLPDLSLFELICIRRNTHVGVKSVSGE